MPWMNVTCGKCGTEADLDKWTRTPLFGELPKGHFQCPGCGFAFERKEVEPGTVHKFRGNGMYIPGRIALVPVPAVM